MAEQQRQQAGQGVPVSRSQQGKQSSRATGQPAFQGAGGQSTGMHGVRRRQRAGGQIGRYGGGRQVQPLREGAPQDARRPEGAPSWRMR